MSKRLARFYDYITVTPVGVDVPADSKSKVKLIDSVITSGKGLLVRTVAQHSARITRNHAMYLPSKINAARGSMISRENGGTAAYNKPVLKNHDDGSPGFFGPGGEGRVLGRAVGNLYIPYNENYQNRTEAFSRGVGYLADAKNDRPAWRYLDVIDELNALGLFREKDWKGMGYLQVDALIVDPDAIAQVMDQRFLTVSTGMTSAEAICSHRDCHQDWVAEGPCDHNPGNDGCFLIAGDLHYEEAFSYVVNPGDGEAVNTEWHLVDLPTAHQSGYTSHMVEQLGPQDSPCELQFSFTDSFRKATTMTEPTNTEAVPATDPVVLEDAVIPTTEAPAEDPVVTEDVELTDSLKLSDADITSLTARLGSFEITEILDGIIPAFSDETSLIAIYDAVAKAYKSQNLELPSVATPVDLTPLNDAIAKVANLTALLDTAQKSKGFLRGELSEFYRAKTALTTELDQAVQTKHDLLADHTSVLRMLTERQGSYEDLKAEQSEKTIIDLETQFNELRSNIDFDKLISRPDITSGVDPNAQVADPTLPGAGTLTESAATGDKKAEETKKYGQFIERFKHLKDVRGTQEANQYLREMKSAGFVPRDFNIGPYLDSPSNDDQTVTGTES